MVTDNLSSIVCLLAINITITKHVSVTMLCIIIASHGIAVDCQCTVVHNKAIDYIKY